MKNIGKVITLFANIIEYIWDKILSYGYKQQMGSCGKNVMLKPSTSIFKGIENLYISQDVRIARYAVIYSTKAKVYIGSKVDIAPYLKIITGNHRTDAVGHFMFDGNVSKKNDNDKDVIIEGDAWFGINVTVLSGVHIGRGSVIAAGSVINRSFPPYSIIGGVPAKLLKYRFSVDEILKHEEMLYPSSQRYTIAEIREFMKEYQPLK